MRIALLSMVESAGTEALATPDAGPLLRANLQLGGISLARHQLGTVLALGCERIVCVAQSLGPELLALQQAAESAGARLQVVSGARGLFGIVNATDEMIGLADGLNAAPELARQLLEPHAAVVVQPIEQGLAAGFERIDINHAGAGAWRIPGRLVERLAELPQDCDPFSALQRIALQSGIAQRALPDAEAGGPDWALVRSEAEASDREAGWIRRHIEAGGPANPSFLLSQLIVRQFGAALLQGGNGSTILAAAGGLLVLMAAIAGWYAWSALALALAAIAWLAFLVAILLGRITRASLRLPAQRVPRALVYGVLVDILLVFLLAWKAGEGPRPETALFAPLMLIGLSRLVGLQGMARWNAWLQDRGVMAIGLALLLAAAPAMVVIQGLAVLALLGGLVVALRRRFG